MSQVIDFVLSLAGLMITVGLASACTLRRSSGRLARNLLIGVLSVYFALATYGVPFIVGHLLTRSYQRFDSSSPAAVSAVVLLGGGDEFIEGWDDGITIASSIETARILEAWRVYRAVDPDWIISSGGPPAPPDRAAPSSTTMRDVLVRFGVPSSRILLESDSVNTYDQATRVVPLLREHGVDRIILVTSKTHMPRALGAFRAVGTDPVAAIAPDHRVPMHWWKWLLPSSEGLDLSREVAHEIAGIAYYWARGRWR